MPDEYFDTIVASLSFSSFTRDHDKGLEEMKRVLKPSGRLIIFESNPITTRGKVLILIENLFHTGAKFYEPFQLSKKLSEEHSLKVISVDSISIGYFLIASKRKDEITP